jgi:glycosyltransferase involved in cell wall biosynthesis
MRILSVTQTYAPFYEFGGPPVKVAALAGGLARRGHGVTVLSADWGVEKRCAGQPGGFTPKRSPFGWAGQANGVESIYLPTWARYRAVSWNPAVKRYCRARLAQFEVVHIFGLYDLLGPAVARECRKRKIPYVVEPVGMYVPIVRNILLKRLYHRIWGAQMLAGAARVIATSEQEAEDVAGGSGFSRRGWIGPEKIVLRRNGVTPPGELPPPGGFRAKYGLPGQALVILFLGRLSGKKSPDLLLDAFARLPNELHGRELRLVLAGPDESGMRARLEGMARVRGVGQRVLFTGTIFGEEKWSAYGDSDLFVLPSQNENFGNTALEAAACGTPVVVTENCGVAALLRGHAGIVVRHETSEIARAMEEILSDGALRSRLAEGGKSATSRLGWEEPVKEMERLYENLVVSPSPALNRRAT